jgi:hypothetical protein
MKFSDIKRFTQAQYSVDVRWSQLIWTLDEWKKDYGLELNPDFQRGHVWDDDKRIKYVEFILKNGQGASDIMFNCKGWSSRDIPSNMVLVDGLQRITAAIMFLENKIPAFGYFFKEYEDDMRLYVRFKFHVNDLETRKEVLQWYLDLNTGGVVHSDQEINKVKQMLETDTDI